MTEPKKRYYLYAPASDPIIIRVIPQLAKAIGLNESLLLLQLDFWIKNTNNYQDGKFWTYQSLRDIQEKAFDFWSLMTIKRAIDSLAKKELIFVANYNQHAYDKTQWFALNPDALRKLPYIQVTEAIIYEPTEGGVSKCDRVYQNDTGVYQNDTTIPEITTIEEKEKTLSPALQDDSATLPTSGLNIEVTEKGVIKITGLNPDKPTKPDKQPKPKSAKRLFTADVKPIILEVLLTYCSQKTHSQMSKAELNQFIKRLTPVLAALQTLDDEQMITPTELSAAFGEFHQKWPNSSYPASPDKVVKLLTEYRVKVRKLTHHGHLIPTPALDSWLEQTPPVIEGEKVDAEFLEQIRLARQNGEIKV